MLSIGKHIKISIIIPVYNARDYIARCLNTLLNQTLRDIEVICVLDCPTDGTDKVVEEYAEKDSRIVIVKNSHNLHVAESRNVGLNIAKGEYIGFSDHDDYRNDMSMYEQLYNKSIESNADIAVSNAIIKNVDNSELLWKFTNINKESLLSANILPMEDDVNPQKITHCIWHSIYRREFLKAHSITFKCRHELLDEDRLFNFEAYFYANNVSFVDKAFYVWEQNVESVTHLNNYNFAPLEIKRTNYYIQFLKEKNLLSLYKKNLWQLISSEIKDNIVSYEQLSSEDFTLLGNIMRAIDYPLLGYRYDLGLISRKRIRLMVINLKAKCNSKK